MFYPIQIFADWLTKSVLNLAEGSRVYAALNFFIFDSIKILILLSIIIFAVTLIRTFIPPEKIKQILTHKHPYLGNALAAIFGIFTPFCTCSAIPLFLGFLEAGVPIGATFSFLIASPMINEVALVLLLGMFGWKVAALYILSGLLIAIIAGIVLGRLGVERLLIKLDLGSDKEEENKAITWQMRLRFGKRYTLSILKKVWPYVLIGIAVGGLIHGYVPADFLARYADSSKWYAVPLATLVGIPLYSNAAGIVPLVSVLTEKGVAIGTVLAFMMAVTGLSLPEFMILRKVMQTKLILLFAAIVGLGIMITGYLFNLILK